MCCHGHTDARTSRLAPCTCDRNGRRKCVKHDRELLLALASKLTSEFILRSFGSKLSICHEDIDAEINNNKNDIKAAAYKVLYCPWYTDLDRGGDGLGLSLHSKGLDTLVEAMYKVELNSYVYDILELHFKLLHDNNTVEARFREFRDKMS